MSHSFLRSGEVVHVRGTHVHCLKCGVSLTGEWLLGLASTVPSHGTLDQMLLSDSCASLYTRTPNSEITDKESRRFLRKQLMLFWEIIPAYCENHTQCK
jgi:hypothetical protein